MKTFHRQSPPPAVAASEAKDVRNFVVVCDYDSFACDIVIQVTHTAESLSLPEILPSIICSITQANNIRR